jgi:PAS domain S-box-containing protein
MKNEIDFLRILHIEDSHQDAELIRERLANFECLIQIDWASSERSFTSYLQQSRYDIVLADYWLPNFDAPAALEKTKLLSPGTPFICISGAIGEEKAVELLKLGATDYVLKDRLDKLPIALRRAIVEVKERKERKLMEDLILQKNEELRKAIEKAEENEKILNLILQYSPILVFLKDENIRAIRLSNNFEQLLGMPLEQILGKSNDELWPSDFAKKMVAQDMIVVKDNHAIVVEEEFNGRYFTTIKFPIQIEGKPRYLAGFSIDITERKHAEEKLQEQTSTLNSTLEKIQQDLSLAKKMQHNTLFTDPSVLEELKIIQAYVPMSEVGGDYYDISKVNDFTYRIFLADATGHGVQAAMITMAIKGIYDNIKIYESGIDTIMKVFNNEYVRKYVSLNSLVTAIIIEIDIRNKKLKFVSAGHPPALLLRGSTTLPLKTNGRMIGVMKDNIYKSTELDFHTSDRLYIFTDGIYEEFNSQEEEFGEERLYSILSKNMNVSIEQSIQDVLNSLDLFLEGKEKNDDITILGMDFNFFDIPPENADERSIET